MIRDTLDIFRLDDHGVRWMDSASTIEDAELRIQEFGGKISAEYLVFNHMTGNKLIIKIDPIRNAEGH